MAKSPSSNLALRSDASVTRTTLLVSAIEPDSRNRVIAEDDEFAALCDSIRVSGLLQPVQVWRQADGKHDIIDGERRWRAAQKVGLTEIPCDVWPADADRRRVAVAALALNEHRSAHGCLDVARRIRDIKNEYGFTLEEVAAHTGLSPDRVKTYSMLLAASEELMTFLEENIIPLKVAAELVRYQKATNEARTRRLLVRHKESPLTVQEIAGLRKREQRPKGSDDTEPGRPRASSGFVDRLEAQVRREPSRLAQLEELARRLGFRLVPLAEAKA